MYRRNSFLAASALLLIGVAACMYNPSFQADDSTLVCKDSNGCPSGYRCVIASGAASGFCCNQPTDNLCSGSQGRDATTAPTDVMATDGPADLNRASDVLVVADANPADRGQTQIPDSSPPSVDAATDPAVDQTGTGGTGDASKPDAPATPDTSDAAVDASDASVGASDTPVATGGADAGGAGGAAGDGGPIATGDAGVPLGFTASPAAIFAGESSTLTWSVTGATSLSIDPGIGSVLGKTSQVVTPNQTTTYTLTLNGSASAQVTVTVLIGVFTPTGNMATGRQLPTATLLQDGKVLVAGGYDGIHYLARAELYDPTLGTFVGIGGMTTVRESATATLLQNGKVLIAGGYDGTAYLTDAEL